MLFWGKKENSNSDIRLAIDLGSGSVGAVLSHTRIKEGVQKTDILASARVPVFFKDDLNFDIYIKGMAGALQKVLTELHNLHLGTPRYISIFLRAPWYSAQVRHITSTRDKDFLVTHTLLSEMINKESALFESSANAKYQELHNTLEIIEEKTLSVELNGYPVNRPIGARVKSLALSFYISASPKMVLETIKESIRAVYPHRKTTFHSYLLSLYVLLRDFIGKEEDFIFLDIGAEISELSIIKNGVLAQSATFPLGIHNVVRALMSQYGISFEEAYSKMRMYSEEVLTLDEQKKISDILKSVNERWVSEFSNGLTTLMKNGTVPSVLYLSTDEAISNWSKSVIENEVFHRYTATDRAFEVIPIETKLFTDHIRLGPNVTRDAFLAAEALYQANVSEIYAKKY